ncbi:MAG: putative porin [Verrucomicrobia bacterium]|nr:putative porin [Verrucomicrobiota bacterium]MBI3869597.1 putative porin [Verrucomicrobiota bacterium]
MDKQTILNKALASGTLITALVAGKAQAQSQDALLDKLVSKGVLTQQEAKDLRSEADDGFKKAYQAKSGMPDWVTSLKLNGDFRGRFDSIFNGQTPDRNRWRYRLRFGAVASLRDDFEVGFRLGSGDASGGIAGVSDPISQNQTLGSNAGKKSLFIDLAYAKWTPIHTSDWSWGLTVGKMENPFVASDIMFDKDYTPEGVATQMKYNFNANHAFRLIGGAFVINEVSGPPPAKESKDPYMFAAQARFDSVWDQKQKWQSTMGIGVFTITHDEQLLHASVPNKNAGNERSNAPGLLKEGFNPIVVDAAVTYTLESFPLYPTKFPITVAGDYIHNPAAQTFKDGYSVGVTLGKSGKRKTWDVGYRFREVQANAWFEEITDSDSGAFYAAADATHGVAAGYQAGTNVRGHIIRANYSPYDSLTFGLTFYDMDAIVESPIGSGSHVGRIQIDAIWKF